MIKRKTKKKGKNKNSFNTISAKWIHYLYENLCFCFKKYALLLLYPVGIKFHLTSSSFVNFIVFHFCGRDMRFTLQYFYLLPISITLFFRILTFI